MTEQKKKVKACKDTEYLFISAYLRAKEPQLLNAEKAGRMLGSSVQEAARILESCGYADVLAVGLDKALSDRRAAVFSEVEALAPKDGVVSLFRMRYDYHNAKTIVKAEAVGIDPAPLLSGAGRADAQALKTAYETGESGSVPQAVLTAMQAARDALSRSADPQLADLILDRAYFAEYHETAAQVGSAFLMGYAQLQADSANLRAAVRARRMHKDINLYKKHPDSLKIVHLLPAAFTLGVVVLLAGAPFCLYSLLPVALYALLVCTDSAIQNKSLRIGLYSIAASFIQLIGYGTGFWRAWWNRCILGKDEFEAFKKNFYK